MRRHQPESDHTITPRGAAAGPDRSRTGNEEGTIVITHRVGTIARAGKRSAENNRITRREHRHLIDSRDEWRRGAERLSALCATQRDALDSRLTRPWTPITKFCD